MSIVVTVLGGIWCVVGLGFGVCFPCVSNSAAISVCIYRMVATILVVLVVWVCVSSYSMYRILLRKFSIL